MAMNQSVVNTFQWCRRYITFPLIVGVAYIVFVLFFNDNSYFKSAQLQEEIDRLHPFGTAGRKNENDLEFGYFHVLINNNCVFQHQGWEDVRLVFWFEG